MLYYSSAYSSAAADISKSFFSSILMFIALSLMFIVPGFVIRTPKNVVPHLTYSFM